MPGIIRGDGIDQVDTVHMSEGADCAVRPGITATAECSSMVFAGDYGVVREGDKVRLHTYPNQCMLHEPVLTTFSSDIIVEGRGIARQGDQYGCGATIITSSSDIILGERKTLTPH